MAMKSLRSAKRMIIGKVLASALLVALVSGVAWRGAAASQCVVILRTPLSQREHDLRHMSAHNSEFVPASELLAFSSCGDVRSPEALLTPDPMLQVQDDDLHVRVSFIVGSDGHVHSPFILDSGGLEEDQSILRAVRRWRYRPALCNGAPTDSETRVRFTPR
jgi:TonB family protein